jgi:predicted enzyme related to lactoylglutathione lyase
VIVRIAFNLSPLADEAVVRVGRRRSHRRADEGGGMDKIVHFEIPADDVARAKAFYGSAFGWEMEDMPGGMDYTLARTVPVDDQQLPTERGAINGGLMKRSADTPSPVLTIGVDSIDEALERVTGGGGAVVQSRQEIPGLGAYAYFTDPEGNVLGLWETLDPESR